MKTYASGKNDNLYEEVKKRIEELEKELEVKICSELGSNKYATDHFVSVYSNDDGFLGVL